jgi:hypothetical protein
VMGQEVGQPLLWQRLLWQRQPLPRRRRPHLSATRVREGGRRGWEVVVWTEAARLGMTRCLGELTPLSFCAPQVCYRPLKKKIQILIKVTTPSRSRLTAAPCVCVCVCARARAPQRRMP